MSAGYEVCLRLHSGVPIVDVLGDWSPAAINALAEMIDVLARAGHYEIVVNIQRAALDGVSALKSLSQLARKIRSHCGHLDVVGTAAQQQELSGQQTQDLFRLAATEESAISRIKRIRVLATGPHCTARPQQEGK